jgi:DNA-binding CsgD family transcriptional regulator
MISNHAFVGGSPRFERREDLAGTIDEVLRLGWSGHFSIARSALVALCEDARVTTTGERAVCRALLALVCVALDDITTARRLARQAISTTSRPVRHTAPPEMRWLRLARVLAANAAYLIGDAGRAKRAVRAQFVAQDPESAWLGALVHRPWQEAPDSLQRHARFVAAVRERHEAQLPSPLTPMEREIFTHLAAGANAVRIAALLGRSTHTVRTHVRNAYAKLGAHNRRDALAKARALGLLNLGVRHLAGPRT